MIRPRASLLHVLLLAVGAAAAIRGALARQNDRGPRARGIHYVEIRDQPAPRQPAEQLQDARGRCPRRGPKPCLFWLPIQKTGDQWARATRARRSSRPSAAAAP